MDKPDSSHSPQAFGPWRVVRPIAAGGMGVVYLGEHAETGERVAIKTISRPDGGHAEAIRREVRALGRLRHPGIVPVVAQGAEGGAPWYAMPFLEGSTLRELLREGSAPDTVPVGASYHTANTWDLEGIGPEHGSQKPVAPQPAARARLFTLLRRLCGALAALHGADLVHRDLKPENIFVQPGDRPVLVDFGLALRISGSSGREVIDARFSDGGTVDYVSPEQLRGEWVDARADLYALGCMIYEVLTGRTPFNGTPAEVIKGHLYRPVVPPIVYTHDISPELNAMVVGLLAKWPRQRIGHMDEVVRVLEGAGAEREAEAPPVPSLYRPDFAGRELPLAQVRAQLDRGLAGEGGLVSVRGESGVGKTRFVMEVARMARRLGFEVIAGECQAPDVDGVHRGSGFHPMRPLLQAVADACFAGGELETARLLGGRGRGLAIYEPILAAVPGFSELTEAPPMEGEAAQHRAVSWMTETLLAFGQGRPLLLLLDDLQWADGLTGELLSALRRGDLGRTVILGTWRAEEENQALASMASSRDVNPVDLPRLDTRAVQDIASDMLGVPRAPEDLVRLLQARCDGNPFFVGEYLRVALAGGLLRRTERGGWELVGDSNELDTLPLPSSLDELVASRLDRLEYSRELVGFAATLGREFPAALFEEQGDDEIGDAVAELIARHVLEPTQNDRLRFTHDMLRESAWQRVPREARAALHDLAANRFETRVAPGQPGRLTRIAWHRLEAGSPARAFPVLRQAAEEARRGADWAEAERLLTRAIELDDAYLFTPRTSLDRAQLLSDRGVSAFRAGHVAVTYESLESSLSTLGFPVPTTRGARVRSTFGGILTQLAHLTLPSKWFRAGPAEHARLQAVAVAARHLAYAALLRNEPLVVLHATLSATNAAEQIGPLAETATDAASIGAIAGFAGLPRLARRYFHRASERMRTRPDPRDGMSALVAQATYHLGLGQLDALVETASKAAHLAETLGDGYQLGVAAEMAARGEMLRGDMCAAMRICEGVIGANQSPVAVVWCRLLHADAMAFQGQTAAAMVALDGVLVELREGPPSSALATALAQLAVCRVDAGDITGALRTISEAQSSTHGGFERNFGAARFHASAATIYLAALESGEDGPADLRRHAESLIVDALAWGRRFPLGMPVALVHRGRLELFLGKTARGVRTLRRGLALAEQLGMRLDAHQIHRMLAHTLAGTVEGGKHAGEAIALESRFMASRA